MDVRRAVIGHARRSRGKSQKKRTHTMIIAPDHRGKRRAAPSRRLRVPRAAGRSRDPKALGVGGLEGRRRAARGGAPGRVCGEELCSGKLWALGKRGHGTVGPMTGDFTFCQWGKATMI